MLSDAVVFGWQEQILKSKGAIKGMRPPHLPEVLQPVLPPGSFLPSHPVLPCQSYGAPSRGWERHATHV